MRVQTNFEKFSINQKRMPCPCDEQKKKGGGYWRKCEKNVLIELLTEPISGALKKLKLTKRNLSNSITSIEEIWITSFHGTWAGSVILSYEKQFFFCDGLKTCVNLRYQSKYQSTSYIYWLLQQLVFFKVCILEKKKKGFVKATKKVRDAGFSWKRSENAGSLLRPPLQDPVRRERAAQKCKEKSFAKIPEIKQEYFYNNRFPTIPSVVYISGALAREAEHHG